jgi:hypothetical protein
VKAVSDRPWILKIVLTNITLHYSCETAPWNGNGQVFIQIIASSLHHQARAEQLCRGEGVWIPSREYGNLRFPVEM